MSTTLRSIINKLSTCSKTTDLTCTLNYLKSLGFQVSNELPSSFRAYRYQQHRWSCGPANLFKKMAMEIIQKEVSTSHKTDFLGEQARLNDLILFDTECVFMEEGLFDIQLLLCKEDCCTHLHIRLLLSDLACYRCIS